RSCIVGRWTAYTTILDRVSRSVGRTFSTSAATLFGRLTRRSTAHLSHILAASSTIDFSEFSKMTALSAVRGPAPRGCCRECRARYERRVRTSSITRIVLCAGAILQVVANTHLAETCRAAITPGNGHIRIFGIDRLRARNSLRDAKFTRSDSEKWSAAKVRELEKIGGPRQWCRGRGCLTAGWRAISVEQPPWR